MSVHYISDKKGKHTAIVIPIKDWDDITSKYQDLKLLEMPQMKPSDFRGAISKKTAEQLLQHVEQESTEWERNIF
jgi:hypothetical protein